MRQLSPTTVLALAARVGTQFGPVEDDGIHLAVGPECKVLPSTVADMNACLNLSQYPPVACVHHRTD